MPLIKVQAAITIKVPDGSTEFLIDELISEVLDKTEEHKAVFDTDITGWEHVTK